MLAKQLRKFGMHVAVADHGGEVLEYLRTTNYRLPASDSDVTNTTINTFSLILTDWKMPVMDGLTCVRIVGSYKNRVYCVGMCP
jgi:CheY-like chemotaxis protein